MCRWCGPPDSVLVKEVDREQLKFADAGVIRWLCTRFLVAIALALTMAVGLITIGKVQEHHLGFAKEKPNHAADNTGHGDDGGSGH